MLQRSPGKALSMTSPLARQRARVRKTGSLDVPEKTRFLSPTASRPAPRRRAKWVSKLYQFSGGPYYLRQQFSTGAQKAREMVSKLYQFSGAVHQFLSQYPVENSRGGLQSSAL